MKLGRVMPVLLLLVFSDIACAYEQATHAVLTMAAFQNSQLFNSESGGLLKTLGLDGYAPLGNGLSYFELINGLDGLSADLRKPQDYELGILADRNVTVARDPIKSWLAFGAIREDDNPSEDPPTPQD